MVDEDFYQIFLLSPFSGRWADQFHSKSQQGVWEAMKTPTFLRASRLPNMDNCQNLLEPEQKVSPVVFWQNILYTFQWVMSLW